MHQPIDPTADDTDLDDVPAADASSEQPDTAPPANAGSMPVASDPGDGPEPSAAPEDGADDGAGEPSAPEAGGPSTPAVAEIDEASMDDMSMMELLMAEGDFMPSKFRRGDVIEGIIVRKDKNQLTLDIGAKQEAIVQAADLARLPHGVVDSLRAGDTVRGVILRPDGEVVVSLYQALTVEDWDRAKALEESGEILELPIVGSNKGGILVQLGNLEGFIPRSHVAQGADASESNARLGQVIPVKVIEVDQRKRRLIVSERQALREWRSARKGRLLDALVEGEVRDGTVSSVTDFGAFVDLGGADGLIHVSEITHERGKSPKDILKVGQDIKVYVLSIDRERSRIGLSLKRLQPDPWINVQRDHYVGEMAEATIANLAKFGAFARLDDGLEGLIHISELVDGHIEHPREAVQVGQRVTVEIIAIDPERKRVGLSIRRVPAHLRTEMPPIEPFDDGDEPNDDRDAGADADRAMAPPSEAVEVEPAAVEPAIVDDAPVAGDEPAGGEPEVIEGDGEEASEDAAAGAPADDSDDAADVAEPGVEGADDEDEAEPS